MVAQLMDKPALRGLAQYQVQWAHLGSNQGPPACEAGALPLSYAPGRNRGAWKECLALLPPGPDAVHTLPPPRPRDGTNGMIRGWFPEPS
jgi:hypothetical protein